MTPEFDVEDDDFEDCLDEESREATARQLSDEALRHTAAIAAMMSAND